MSNIAVAAVLLFSAVLGVRLSIISHAPSINLAGIGEEEHTCSLAGGRDGCLSMETIPPSRFTAGKAGMRKNSFSEPTCSVVPGALLVIRVLLGVGFRTCPCKNGKPLALVDYGQDDIYEPEDMQWISEYESSGVESRDAKEDKNDEDGKYEEDDADEGDDADEENYDFEIRNANQSQPLLQTMHSAMPDDEFKGIQDCLRNHPMQHSNVNDDHTFKGTRGFVVSFTYDGVYNLMNHPHFACLEPYFRRHLISDTNAFVLNMVWADVPDYSRELSIEPHVDNGMY